MQGFQSFSKIKKSGIPTAITIYILIVCLVYQLILRSAWTPTGLQKLVDELLHSIIPILVLIYWYLYENKKDLSYQQIPYWAIYPLIYLLLYLDKRLFFRFLSLSFVNVLDLGYFQVFISPWVLLLFVMLSILFIRIAKSLNR
jgi:hypothetical protein